MKTQSKQPLCPCKVCRRSLYHSPEYSCTVPRSFHLDRTFHPQKNMLYNILQLVFSLTISSFSISEHADLPQSFKMLCGIRLCGGLGRWFSRLLGFITEFLLVFSPRLVTVTCVTSHLSSPVPQRLQLSLCSRWLPA